MDSNIQKALEIILQSPIPESYPEEFKDVDNRAILVDKIDSTLGSLSSMETQDKVYELSQKVCEIVKESFKGISQEDNFLWLNVLRLWVGCLLSAKNLSDKDSQGPLDDNFRRDAFTTLQEWCEGDAVIKLGVEAGPILRRLRNQEIVTTGIPSESFVRKFID